MNGQIKPILTMSSGSFIMEIMKRWQHLPKEEQKVIHDELQLLRKAVQYETLADCEQAVLKVKTFLR